MPVAECSYCSCLVLVCVRANLGIPFSLYYDEFLPWWFRYYAIWLFVKHFYFFIIRIRG